MKEFAQKNAKKLKRIRSGKNDIITIAQRNGLILELSHLPAVYIGDFLNCAPSYAQRVIHYKQNGL